ncbi:MAG TPA: glycosyltransferase family 4 protein, partial [Phycisphaerae bacterium]
VGDELELQAALALRFTKADADRTPTINGMINLQTPLLACIIDKHMMPWMPGVHGRPTIGYTFFEENVLEPAWLANARKNFDHIATGSSWCTKVLTDYGLTDVSTVIQGVDPRVFFPWPTTGTLPGREFLKDRFVIFSGGKFELRKGQDIVIRAVKVLQERHPDVWLINSWFNPWQSSFDTMRGSPYLRFPNLTGNFVEVMNRILADNGVDISRVITLGPRANALMARIYRNTDVGIFTNRCEGGTNLVLMEYMACGKPVVAVNSTGHSDVVRPDNALVINIKSENTINGANGPVARWPEPDLDDAIAKLEYAYQNRDAIMQLGTKAGTDMAACTWTKAAQAFLAILTRP